MPSRIEEVDRFKSLIESVADRLWEIDSRGYFTYSSPQVYQILGYTPEEVIGHKPLDFMTREAAKKVKPYFYETLKEQKGILLIETDHLHKDGRTICIETSAKAIFDKSGAFIGLRGVDRDITDKQRSQRQTNTLLAAVDQMAEAAVFADPELHITYVNRAFSEVFGYEQQDILGKDASILNSTNPSDITIATVAKALKKQGVWEGEVMRKRADGECIPVFLHVSTIYDDNKIIGYAGTYLNLSDAHLTQKQLQSAYKSTITAISLTVEQRDPYTSGHQNNVAALSRKVALVLGESNDFIEGIGLGASIHDLGKINIPAEILTYPGKLSPLHYELIKTHAQGGYNIIKDVEFPWPVKTMVLQHHEKLDGSGYPQGLKGDQIIKEAKIIAVCDVVDAVTSHRPYRAAKPLSSALSIISEGKSTHYDPDCVDALVSIIEQEPKPVVM